MPFKVRLDRPVFALYVGLTASGYDLAQVSSEDPLAALVDAIQSHRWPAAAISYFRRASIEGQGVNPYWPRAAMLLDAAFHLDNSEAGGYVNEEGLLANLARFPTGPESRGAETVSWIREFPGMQRQVELDRAFPVLWDRYREIMSQGRLCPFEEAARDAIAQIATGLEAQVAELPDLIVVPNPLQAPQIADFVRKGNVLFAIVADARPESIAHELLHSVFQDALARERRAIESYRWLFSREIVDAMVKRQYAWDAGVDSWLRVFEESLVRAATIWIARRDNPEESGRLAQSQFAEGFAYVPAILRAFSEEWRSPKEMRGFIRFCLSVLSDQLS